MLWIQYLTKDYGELDVHFLADSEQAALCFSKKMSETKDGNKTRVWVEGGKKVEPRRWTSIVEQTVINDGSDKVFYKDKLWDGKKKGRRAKEKCEQGGSSDVIT